MEQEEHLNLDQESLKAITVPTRINILKVLSRKQQTLSDLSQILSLSAPALKEHLTVLEKVQMIQKLEEGRKWKYYRITEKGLDLLFPERKRIWITLSLLILSVIGSVASFFQYFSSSKISALSAGAFEEASAAAPQLAKAPAQHPYTFQMPPFIFPILTLIFLLILIYYLLKYRKSKYSKIIKK